MMSDGEVVLITGAARGIGQVTARYLAGAGYTVVATDADGAALAATERAWLAGECLPVVPHEPGAGAGTGTGRGTAARVPAGVAQAAGTIVWAVVDVGNEQHAQRAAELAAQYGPLVALVNNAAISSPAPPTALTVENWNRVLAVNLTGPFLMSKHAAPALEAAARRLDRSTAIVNIASTRAYMSEPHTEAYAASKGGVVALTHALAMSLGPLIRVNAVAPGWIEVGHLRQTSAAPTVSAAPTAPTALRAIDHQQHPAGRVGHAADVAAMIAFLIGEESSFITGHVLPVDGGMLRKMIYTD